MQKAIESLAPIFEVPSVVEAAAFYRDKLGFTVAFVAESPRLATYGAVHRDGWEIHFMERHARDVSDVRSGMYVTVADADALYHEFRERGAFDTAFPRHLAAIREHPPEDKEYGLRDMIFVDPNGYILAFGHPLARPS